ncbi:methyl-accepting chemotaxis protein, partial [Variovorax sp. N23]|nr:methyl-accepting chemotaxis protein [Variovorax sp. N23]
TQQNAALVEEAAAAAASLQEQAGSLVEAVGIFRIDEGAGAVEPGFTPIVAKPAPRSFAPAAPAARAPAAGRPVALQARKPAPKALPAGDDGDWAEF